MTHTHTPTAKPHARSRSAYKQAQQLMPGGVSSPVRAFHAVGGEPITIREGKDCRVTDIDGNTYIDYIGSYGPLIVGHAPDEVVVAITKAAGNGVSFGMPTEAETQLAQTIVQALPSVEMVRFVNSGTEATMSALRAARAATGREKIVKCIGGYHGHSDPLLVEAGSGAATLGVPSSPGVPGSIASQTLLMPYNDIAAAEELFAEHEGEIAALIIEPVAGNMGCVPPLKGYLDALRTLCDQSGAMLIFDEVMTGFRVAYGGAQQLYGVIPDLTAMGKIIGGGLPCAAYGGRGSIMQQIAPDGPVYQAGTLSGSPVAMAAGQATLDLLQEDGVYEQLETRSAELEEGLVDAANRAGASAQVSRMGSMLSVFFCDHAVRNYSDAASSDAHAFARFFHVMLEEGVMIPPSPLEVWFVGMAHDEQAIQHTLAAASRAFEATRR